MSSSVCKACGRENQSLYKFCLGCGAELGELTVDAGGTAQLERGAPAKAAPHPHDTLDDDEYNLRDRRDSLAHLKAPLPDVIPLDEATPISASRMCPTCGNLVAGEFSFCAQCGGRLDGEIGVSTGSNNKASASGATVGRLVLVRPDGTEGGTHPLVEGENVIGRGHGTLFDADGYLSPRHAELILNAAGLVVRDTGSLNGIFVKLDDEQELADGEIFRIGQELLRFDEISAPVPLDDGTDVMGSPNPGYWGRLALIVGRDQDGSAFPMFGDAVTLGRERGDILFPEDGYVSGQHARVSLRDGKFWLTDLNSSNGTFVRIRGERAVKSGAYVLMGQQLFRISY
ncbi:MAG TPA: FHA domain-containing protein [Polyangia bacterium]|jgi:pSer/pThr/pTyr-binding forkhead associated (FHA) protein|nr:FHA domain-containing protein [Polyangia bacterium]